MLSTSTTPCWKSPKGQMSVEDLIPPAELLIDGSTPESFVWLGEGFALVNVVERGRLQPHESVLDMGCGNGGKARVLARHLNQDGRYEGLDISAPAIAWCQNAYRRFTNFRFTHADIYSSFYNETGRQKAVDYRFPYDDAEFDMVFLVSVFTHLLPDEISNYIHECARVLRPKGRLVASVFLLNEQTRRRMQIGAPHYRFVNDDGLCAVVDPAKPAKGVAQDENNLRKILEDNNLVMSEVIYGHWDGRSPAPINSMHDAFIAIKQ